MKIFLLLIIAVLIPAISYAQSGHWEQLYPENSPRKRYNHGMCQIDTNKIIIHGGFTYKGGYNDDLWLYDGENNAWTELKPKTFPSARMSHDIARLTKTKILLFGGFESQMFGDTWIYDLETNEWEEIFPEHIPPAREMHNLIPLKDSVVFLFGGHDAATVSFAKSRWKFDLAKRDWIFVDSLWYKPLYRANTDGANIGDNKLIIFSGWQHQLLNDVWVFDDNQKYSSRKWKEVIYSNYDLAMKNHSVARINGNYILIFGGEIFPGKGQENRSLIWRIPDSTLIDLKIKEEESPMGVAFHRMANLERNKVLLFGGIGEDAYNKNETWIFTFDPEVGVEEVENEDLKLRNDIVDEELELILTKNVVTKIIYGVYDLNGRNVQSGILQTGTGSTKIDIRMLGKGMYFLRIAVGDKSYNLKFIKV
jgi:N-acetylneuraminic acid mutarotase